MSLFELGSGEDLSNKNFAKFIGAAVALVALRSCGSYGTSRAPSG